MRQGIFPPSRLPVQTLLRCPYSPCVQPHASTSVRTLKIPNAGGYAIVWTHGNTAHTDRSGLCCSYCCCVSVTLISHKGQRSTKNTAHTDRSGLCCSYCCCVSVTLISHKGQRSTKKKREKKKEKKKKKKKKKGRVVFSKSNAA